MIDRVKLTLGGGGKETNNFIKNYILKYIGNSHLNNLRDAAKLSFDSGFELAFTTDSFVVIPEFFPGGDIGKLAVFGTCNDLSVSGAKPMYISLSFIVSEGYEIEKLEQIIKSIKSASEEAGVEVVCGDTKVIERGEKENILINTAGIGMMMKDLNDYGQIKVGDKVIITSDIGRHGLSVVVARNEFGLSSDIKSDCCNLYKIFDKIGYSGIKFARDATRGGVAAVLNEIAEKSNIGFSIFEEKIPVLENVKYLSEFLGFDFLHIANEGVAVLICDSDKSEEIVSRLTSIDISKNAKIVGEVISEDRVFLINEYGGKRVLDVSDGNLLPRIC
jgi:hydrogenase expression/formation protein HypE